jgi:hypothetical protein
MIARERERESWGSTYYGKRYTCVDSGVPIRNVDHMKGFPIVRGRSRKTMGQTIKNDLN